MLPLQWFCCVFAVALTALPYGDTVCTPGAMMLRVAISQNKMSACSHAFSYLGEHTVEQCQRETCRLGCNTFNHGTNGACFIKRCSDGDLKLKDATDKRANVYSLYPVCTDAPYVQVKRATDGVFSDCQHLGGSRTDTVEECRRATCAAGGNTFNIGDNPRNNNCHMKLCTGGNMLWTTNQRGFDVYAILPCFNNNGGCNQLCHDNGIVTSCSCRSGFMLQSDLKTCRDINECDNSRCSQNCTNTLGSYYCNCTLGYELASNNHDCRDIDECSRVPSPCSQRCENTPGSYICKCLSGYRLERKTQCVDVNECDEGLHGCNQTCTNIPGSFTCNCTNGFTSGDRGKLCHDVNECASNPCPLVCTNTYGGYSCSSCEAGYRIADGGHQCEECPAGTYGLDCASQCSESCAQPPCDPISGSCNADCVEGWTGDMCQTSLAGPTDGNDWAMIGGVVGAILALAVVFVVLVILWRRGMLPKIGRRTRSDSIERTMDTPDVVKVTSNGDVNPKSITTLTPNKTTPVVTLEREKDLVVRPKPTVKPPPGKKPSKPLTEKSNIIPISRLSQYIVSGKEQNSTTFQEEFKAIGLDLRGTFNAAEAAPTVKNKFKNIFPYDHSLVTLQQPDAKGCSYINANYINLNNNEAKYIASQGPQPLTTNDFWKMVWEVNCNVIVMLTNPVELGKRKCDEYWPDTWTSYDDIKVTRLKVEEYDEFNRRTFTLSKENTERTLTQYHFTSWLDHSVPVHPTGLLQMLMKMRKDVKPNKYVIVHCSAGVGRTGTFITIDQLLKQADKEGQVDAPSLVNKLRDSRQKMVQTAIQYIFIYDAVLEATVVGSTGIPCSEAADLDACRDRMKTQYKFLSSTTRVPTAEETSDALNPRNAKKNRSKDYLPMNKAIATLKGSDSTQNGYINAVFVQGYDKQQFIATQVPLKETMADFWTLVTDNKCSTIVVLEENKELDTLCTKFLPNGANGKVRSGQFHVEVTSTETLTTATVHSLKIVQEAVVEAVADPCEEPLYQNAEEKKPKPQTTDVEPFDTHVIRPRKDMSNAFMVDVFEKVQILQKKHRKSPVLIVCRDAVSLCGLYLGASNVFSRVKQECEVDIFYTVRNIRKSNPYFIVDEAQYLRLLAAAGEYMRTFDTYDNFR